MGSADRELILQALATFEAEAERRGAERALRDAADVWYTDNGPEHPLSAVTWLTARADALAGRPVEEGEG